MFYDSLIFLTTWTRCGRVAFFSFFLRANVKIRALDSPPPFSPLANYLSEYFEMKF